MKSKILIALLVAAACLPAVSNAAPINTATVRSTVLSVPWGPCRGAWVPGAHS